MAELGKDGKIGEFKWDIEEPLFSTFFFLSNIRGEHSRKVYNILNLLTELGGIQGSLFAFMSMIATYMNTQMYISKMMFETQYVTLHEEEKNDPNFMKRITPL